MIRRPKRYRCDHIHSCRRREKAKQLDQQQSRLEYCFDCTEWYVKDAEWDEHCQLHLSQPLPQRCGSMTYCSTLIRPAFCLLCLPADKPASLRMRSWERDADVFLHIEREHKVKNCCDTAFKDDQSLFYHLSDKHDLRHSPKRKRLGDDIDQGKKRKVTKEEVPDTAYMAPALEIHH